MENPTSAASTAHKEAAAEHSNCATQHLQAAASHDSNKHDDAMASKQSANACASTSK